MPLLRHFRIQTNEQTTLQTDIRPDAVVNGGWEVSNPETAAGFSASGYHFGANLQRSLGIPIGMISSARSGASIESRPPNPTSDMKKVLLTIITLLCACVHLQADVPIGSLSLRCENRINPLGVDTLKPRLSWVLESERRGVRQTVYRVLVASKPSHLSENRGDLWDSGKIVAGEYQLITYQGMPLASQQTVYWKVLVDLDDTTTVESDVATWTMGFVSPQEWKARWITSSDQGKGLPVFRKTFMVDGRLERALVHVSGLGQYELFLNEQKVEQHFLTPAWSVYRKTAYYNQFDITGLLKQGTNEFRIMLGKGFYNTEGDRRVHGVNSKGVLMTILEAHLAYADGSREVVVTDDSWDSAAGPILHSAIVAGSDYDARGAEPTEWSKATITNAAGTLRAVESPPMQMFETLSPIKRADEPESGIFVYDFGQNLSAIPFIRVRGKIGQTVRLTPAEQRHDQTEKRNNGTGLVNQAGVGRPNYYEYTLSGEGQETWHPQFTYGGFQYLQVEGAVPQDRENPHGLPVIEEIQSVHVRSSVRPVGSFACSNPLFVGIDEMIDRAVRSNLGHVLTDCPTREKLGWLEVAYLMGPSISRRYDLSLLGAKITRDIRESQGANGAIYTVAPSYPDDFKGGFQYTPEWGAAGVIIPWQLYRWYGDRRVLEENLPTMKAFVDYMKDTGENLVPKAGLGDWYDYGHGESSGRARFTPPELTAMATFYRCAHIVAKTAEVLGNEHDAKSYRELAGRIRERFNAEFYVGDGQYRNHGSPQTANAMALVTGLCEPQHEQAVLEAILADLKTRNYQQTAGDIGFHYLMEALARYGLHETVYRMLDRKEVGSYAAILERGWNSLPEAWDANTSASMNHCMLGHIQQWFYMDLVGIRQAPDSIGFRNIIIKPAFDTEIEWAKGHYDAAPGRIGVDWKKRAESFLIEVVIPPNTTALVKIPAKDAASVSESGSPLDQAEGVRFLEMENGLAVIQVGSGRYKFMSRMPRAKK